MDARRAVQSIAFQLASYLPDYAQHLNALDLDCLAVADPRGAFNALVEAPLGSDFPEPLWLPILSGTDMIGNEDLNTLLKHVLQ